MSKHTPGPWIAAFSKDVNEVMIGKEGLNGDVSPGGYVGCAGKVADGYLIAAAPELLEAAKIGLAYIESEEGSDKSDSARVRAAIAKAEGRGE